MNNSGFTACVNPSQGVGCASFLYNDMATASIPQSLDRASLQKVAELFRIFSEPTRLGILQFLKGQSTSVNDIVEALETSQANISKQLRILYDADLLTREQKGNQVFYSIKEDMVFDLCDIVCDKLNRSAQAGADSFYQIWSSRWGKSAGGGRILGNLSRQNQIFAIWTTFPVFAGWFRGDGSKSTWIAPSPHGLIASPNA